jgi:hypothetical protein
MADSSEAANARRRTVENKWKRTKEVSYGAFGMVWLEKETETGHLRAVKEISKNESTTARKDYAKELAMLAHLSKVSFRPDALTDRFD